MQDSTPPENTAKPKKPVEITKADRLKAALKANMGRRKAQARARADHGLRGPGQVESDDKNNMMDE